MKRILETGNKIIAALIVVMTILAIFLPIFDISLHFQDYLVHFLILLIISGLIGLILSNNILLYTGFGCAAALALFLKNASNTELKDPKINDKTKLTIAHLNVSLITDIETIQQVVKDSIIDVISFQEYTPDWANIMPQILKKDFPYTYEDVRIDLYGKCFFSKYPLHNSKILKYIDIPNIESEIQLGQDVFKIFSTYLTPALDKRSKSLAKEQFDAVTKYHLREHNPKIIIGEFNQVYWSHDILAFRTKTGLLNSRRNVSPTTLKVPYDHIFYSPDLECYYFEELNDIQGNHIGCKASFQLKNVKSRKLR